MPYRRRNFCVRIHRVEYEKICEWTLMKKHIETGGDLFGLWFDSYTPVVQLVLGPGKKVRRTSTSFYQDSGYLEQAGSYLTQNEGLCHIGEWHSHHQLGLDRPSGGDESTVWGNMPQYGLNRFFIFITNIRPGFPELLVNINCFLFEMDPATKRSLPVLQGELKILESTSSLRDNPRVRQILSAGAEDALCSQDTFVNAGTIPMNISDLNHEINGQPASSDSDETGEDLFVETEYVVITKEEIDRADAEINRRQQMDSEPSIIKTEIQITDRIIAKEDRSNDSDGDNLFVETEYVGITKEEIDRADAEINRRQQIDSEPGSGCSIIIKTEIQVTDKEHRSSDSYDDGIYEYEEDDYVIVYITHSIIKHRLCDPDERHSFIEEDYDMISEEDTKNTK